MQCKKANEHGRRNGTLKPLQPSYLRRSSVLKCQIAMKYCSYFTVKHQIIFLNVKHT